MVRDAAATRRRILDAATQEFAERGLAGARVDQIAARAEANKERIYAYFGSKEALFDATVEHHLDQLLDAVPFDAMDLPGYAGRLFDFTVAHPELVRLALWHGLERPGVLAALPATVASMVKKFDAVVAAQAAGAIDPTLDPANLLQVVLAVVHGDLLASPHGEGDPVARRAALVAAVARLSAPPA